MLFTVAYELLGSAADAEDVLQESWLRWASVDRSQIREPRAYLVRIVTRQALNHLRTVARRREDYVGEWLPEPLLTSPDVADDVELAENVSIAMLTVLETLGPAERAVFVLREVFDVPYDEIADAVGKSPAAVRQIAHRAKDHVSARRPRVRVVVPSTRRWSNGWSPPSTPATCRASWTSSRPTWSRSPTEAARSAARRAGRSSARIGWHDTWSAGWRRSTVCSLRAATWVNGQPGIRMELDGQLVGVVASPSSTDE